MRCPAGILRPLHRQGACAWYKSGLQEAVKHDRAGGPTGPSDEKPEADRAAICQRMGRTPRVGVLPPRGGGVNRSRCGFMTGRTTTISPRRQLGEPSVVHRIPAHCDRLGRRSALSAGPLPGVRLAEVQGRASELAAPVASLVETARHQPNLQLMHGGYILASFNRDPCQSAGMPTHCSRFGNC